MPNIKYPWIIVHQPAGEDGPIETILAGPPGTTYEHFGLAICDIARHVAKAFNVDEDDIWTWVMRERFNPTTSITRKFNS